MPDISKVNGVEVGNISKVDNAETGNINTLLSGSFPAQQSDPALTGLTNEDFNPHRVSGLATAYNPNDSIMIFQYGDANNSYYATVVCATASGSTLSYGDEVVINSQADSFSSGVVYNDDQDRVMGAFMVYSGSDINTVKAYAASITTSGSGSPKISNIGTVSDVYAPHNDGGSGNANLHGPEGQMCIYDHSDGASSGRMLVFFGKGGPASGSSVAGNRGDVVGAAVTITDVSSDNDITVGALQLLVSGGLSDVDPPMVWSWNEQRNKVVLFTQDTSGTYQVQAATVTGTGATMTVGTQYLLDTGSANVLFHNSAYGYDGTSESRFRMDNSKRVVYDSTNNCHHVFIFDDTYDDFHVFNCTVAADNSITWSSSNGSPVRSNGMIAQYPNVFTNGLTTGFGGTSAYITLGLAFSAGRGRGAVLGHNGTNHSSADTNVAGFVYSTTTGYNFTGNYFEMFTNKPKKQVTSPSGTTHLSDDGFVGKNLFFVGSNQDNDGMSEIGAFDTGVGQRAASGGVFSASNATLSTARTRCAGLGTSRIASMVVGGQNTSSTYLNTGEEYNGSVVTAAGDTLSAAKNQPGACGSLTAGLVQGGYLGSDGSKTSDEYDGTNFTSGGTASTVGGDGSRIAGTQTDALATGGYITGYRDDSESYNGTSFTTEADTPATTNYHAMAGTGHEDAYCFLGTDSGGSATNQTFNYDGTSWSTLNTAPNSINSFLGGGTGEDFLVVRKGANASMIWNGTSWASGSTNGISNLDFYSGSPDADCGGTSAWVAFGGGTGSAASTGQATITHHDR